MHLKELSIVNFKNILQANLQLSPKINCFIGDNGMGKTNVLDAIYYLSFCKSYFSAQDSFTINHEQDFMVLQGNYEQSKEHSEKYHCGLKRRSKKVFKRNNVAYTRLSEHIAKLPLVMISPSDNTLVVGSGEERRRYMNSVISQIDKHYLDAVIKYNHALAQRNALLKQLQKGKQKDSSLVELWDDQLAQTGQIIFERRKQFVLEILPFFNRSHQDICLEREHASISYISDLENTNFKTLLQDTLRKDILLGYTSKGVHRDDLSMFIGDFPLKKIGSQGQAKSFLIALKLAQFELLYQALNKKPILLLDDIFDKLDASRVERIVELVAQDHFGQIFITDTNLKHLTEILGGIIQEKFIFNVADGQVSIS